MAAGFGIMSNIGCDYRPNGASRGIGADESGATVKTKGGVKMDKN